MGKQSLDGLLKNEEEGNMGITLLLGIVAMPVCAYLGSYLGEGVGWLTGNIVDVIPLANNVAPWIAERTGLIHDTQNVANLNENLYQTSGAVGGFWAGLCIPSKLITRLYND